MALTPVGVTSPPCLRVGGLYFVLDTSGVVCYLRDMKNTTTREAAMDVVEQAEIALKSFLDANYGPLWGEKQEQEYAALAAKLEGLYYEFDIPEDDRMYC